MSADPAFSVVIETLNLQHEPLHRFREMLESLDRQTLSLHQAVEAVVLDTHDVDSDELRTLCEGHDWLSVIESESGLSYDHVKKLGFQKTTAEIVVLADSDCLYEPQWLESLLSPFAEPAAQIVAGETSTEIRGAYSLAMSMTGVFPRFSGETSVGRAANYEFNNVAIRRDLLAHVPIPADMAAERGCGFLHALELQRAGIPILRHPRARAHHPIAGSIGRFTEHFLDRGLDSACVAARLNYPFGKSYRRSSRFAKVVERARKSLAEDPKRWRLMPLAVPIAAVSVLIYIVGRTNGRLVAARAERAAA